MMATQLTTDKEIIQDWVEQRGGEPARIKGTEALLRIKFDQSEEDLESISWDDFWQMFEEAHLAFLYEDEKDNRFFKFVQR